jgi:hypothetical protein
LVSHMGRQTLTERTKATPSFDNQGQRSQSAHVHDEGDTSISDLEVVKG